MPPRSPILYRTRTLAFLTKHFSASARLCHNGHLWFMWLGKVDNCLSRETGVSIWRLADLQQVTKQEPFYEDAPQVFGIVVWI